MLESIALKGHPSHRTEAVRSGRRRDELTPIILSYRVGRFRDELTHPFGIKQEGRS